MKALHSLMHPTFDALSAFADAPSVPGARSRVGRHVARCAQCAEVVAEIRAMGESARAWSEAEDARMQLASSGAMWDRIANAVEGSADAPREVVRSLRAEEVEVRRDVAARGDTSVHAESSGAAIGTSKTRGAGRPLTATLLVAVAVVSVIALWPGNRSLEASSVSRLTFTPGRPVPGGVMHVRYTPVATLAGAPRLVLVGHWTNDAEPGWFGELLLDSLATLRPSSNGVYDGDVRLPAKFLGVELAVADSSGAHVDADGISMWLVVAGDAAGRPSLPALLANAQRRPWYSGTSRLAPTQQVNVSDSLKRYFPDMPAGWAYARRGSESRGSFVERMVAFFESTQRKYASFDARFWPDANLDAERTIEMAALAGAIDEPREASKWAFRFAEKFPGDPRAFTLLANALHQVELREPPALADSIRPWFPLLERTLIAGMHADSAARFDTTIVGLRASSTPLRWRWEEAFTLAHRYGDPALTARMDALLDARGEGADMVYWNDDIARDPVALRKLEPRWQAVATRSCTRPNGKFSLTVRFGVGGWESSCQRNKVFAWTYLARSALLGDHLGEAARFADSAVSVRLSPCGTFLPASLSRTRVDLARGDTAAAERDLLEVVAVQPGYRAVTDSVPAWLGSHYNADRFKASSDSAHAAFTSCRAREKQATR